MFIAKRLIIGKASKSSISTPILKIAIAAIALGMVMMLIAIATGVGLKHKIREKVAAFNGHLQISNYDNNTSEVSVVPISMTQDFYPEFNEVAGVTHIQAVATKGGIIRTEDTFEGVLAKGVGGDYDWTTFREYLVEGRLPDFTGSLNTEVLLSQTLARRLQLGVDDTFFSFFLKESNPAKAPNTRKFTIVGLYQSGFEEFDATHVFIDLRHIQQMNRWTKDQIGHFEVFLEDFDQVTEKSSEIYSKTPSYLDTRSITAKYHSIFEWIELFDFNIALIIGIMILVGGINMITALLVLILERTPMIGILKALGATDWSIRKVFLYHAAYLIALGLLWGNAVGLGLLFLQDKYRIFSFPNPEDYYMDYIPVYIDTPTLVLLNMGVMLLCISMLLLPSYSIAKISPVKAIAFK